MPEFAARPFDDDNELDWMGYWVNRVFGKSAFSLHEILNTRNWRVEMESIVQTYFEYMWDQDIEQTRETRQQRDDIEQMAIDWVGNVIDNVLQSLERGEDLSRQMIEFDNRLGRSEDQRRRGRSEQVR